MTDLINELRKAAKESFFYGDLMNRAADAIEELSKPRWIPVTERLPEKHERVLVYSKATRMGRSIDFINSDGNWYTTSQVTHWMPLPEPPKEE